MNTREGATMNACDGHPAGAFDPMGMTVYCDGSCKPKNATKHFHVLVGYFNGDRKFVSMDDAVFSDRRDAVAKRDRVRVESAKGWTARMHACSLGCEE